jgi:hypothetical protein
MGERILTTVAQFRDKQNNLKCLINSTRSPCITWFVSTCSVLLVIHFREKGVVHRTEYRFSFLYFVDRASSYNSLLMTNLTHFCISLFITSLYMFRA